MTATVFPAYGLARMVVPNWYALAAAGAAVAVPALAYSPILVEEPLAYPLSTLRALAHRARARAPSWGRLAAAAAVCRRRGARHERSSRSSSRCSRSGCSGSPGSPSPRGAGGPSWSAVGLGGRGHPGRSASRSRSPPRWATPRRPGANTMFIYKDRIFEHASWAIGALAIGIGVLPVARRGRRARAAEGRRRATRGRAPSSSRASPRWPSSSRTRASRARTSRRSSRRYVVERNLIYLCPLLFAATALAFARGVGRGWAIAGAAVFTLYVVTADAARASTSTRTTRRTASRSRRSRTASSAGRRGRSRRVLVARLRRRARRRRRAQAPARAARSATRRRGHGGGRRRRLEHDGAGVRGRGRADSSPSRSTRTSRSRTTGSSEATGGGSVVVIGQQISDPTNIWLTEFFNPSVRKMWSLDGTALRGGRPDPHAGPRRDRRNAHAIAGTEYALAVNGVALQAPVVARREGRRPLPHRRRPAAARRMRSIGRESDGWMIGIERGPRRARLVHALRRLRATGRGSPSSSLTRVGWCPNPGARTTGKVTVRIGPVGIGPDKQPRDRARHRDADVRRARLQGERGRRSARRTSRGAWRSRVAPTFVPAEIDPVEERPPPARRRASTVPASSRSSGG